MTHRASVCRQGYDLQLTQYDGRGWRATFYTTGMEHSPVSAIGTAWERTPWRAAQRAAWEVDEIVVTQLVAVGTADPLRRLHPTFSEPTRMEATRIAGTAGMADSLQNFHNGVISHEAAGSKESSKDEQTRSCARD